MDSNYILWAEGFVVDSVVPARFFWVAESGEITLKEAVLYNRGDRMEFLCSACLRSHRPRLGFWVARVGTGSLSGGGGRTRWSWKGVGEVLEKR